MIIDDIALTFIPQLGVRGIVHLLEIFGDAAAIFAASEQELIERAELRSDIAKSIVSKRGYAEAERELKYCEKNGIRPISSTNADYSDRLRFTSDYPHILYTIGSASSLQAERVLSIVGTRKMTPYGERICNQILEVVADKFPDTVVVSGLAYGADVAAHRAAVRFGLRTVGVVANALPDITPAMNRALARTMVEHGGAVVTEVSSRTPQNGNLYIPRNRIVAGVADGLLILESPAGGGSMHTARAADGYSRTVMAVPGRGTDTMSVGTNWLIRTGMAQLVSSAEHLFESMNWRPADAVPEKLYVSEREFNEKELRILAAIGDDGTPLDVIIERCGYSAGEVVATLLEMELSDVVCQLPGKIYEKR